MTSRPDVLIVGGGVVGAACAAELSRRGVAVTLIDKGPIGHGCSYGNAGWITPSFALPLPRPGMLLKSLKWLCDPDSPLYIKPRLDWELARWLLRFLRSMNHRSLQRSAAALIELSTFGLGFYRDLAAEQPGAFGFEQRGLLVVAQTEAGRQAAQTEMEIVGRYGVAGRPLDASGVRTLEPAISGPNISGGVIYPAEAHVEPLAAVLALIKRAEVHGARVQPGTEVFEVLTHGRRVEGVRTTRGWIKADQVVWAVGAWSPQFARALGLRIPVLSGKGYAVTVAPLAASPSIPCLLIEKKIAVTPREASLRLSGTLELVGIDDSITPRRVRAIIDGARQYLAMPAEPQILEVWRGLRPCTPDGLPMIGRIPGLDNVLMATGHQMLGLQTAPATGRLVADLLLGQTPRFDPQPFRAERFR